VVSISGVGENVAAAIDGGVIVQVSEVFFSLQGEGTRAGIPTVFVRLAGCNLAMQNRPCSYCDSAYAWKPEDGEEMSVDEVAKKVRSFRRDSWVLITGGEPLARDISELVRQLKGCGYKIEVETNGSIDPPEWSSLIDCWSVDVKCPSSGPSYGSFRTKWLKRLRKQDSLKFVVGTQEDLNFVRGFLNNTRLRPTVLVSPVTGILLNKKGGTIEEYWNREWLQECAEFCKEQNVRLSLQIHRIVWGNKRAV